jgi:hypothetical protein
MLLQVSDCFDGVFMLLFFSFVYRLCASLMSRLVPVIMLLQRPGVIGILLILIYSLYRKEQVIKNGVIICIYLYIKNIITYHISLIIQ